MKKSKKDPVLLEIPFSPSTKKSFSKPAYTRSFDNTAASSLFGDLDSAGDFFGKLSNMADDSYKFAPAAERAQGFKGCVKSF